MLSLRRKSLKEGLAVIAATSAMLAASVREAAPGRHPDTFSPAAASVAKEVQVSSSTLRPQDLVLLEELQAWLEPAESDRAIGPARAPLANRVREHRESFGLFVGLADGAAVRDRLEHVPFGPEILEASDRYGLDPLLIAAVVEAESGFDAQAVSPRGALGLMQVMPETAEHLGVVNVSDPRGNLEAGASYLVFLLRRFEDDVVLSLAAYNAGPRAVDRFGGLPVFPETRRFTERVLRIYIEHHRAAWAAAKGGQHEPLFPVVGRGAAPA